jgi:hypothetical protein
MNNLKWQSAELEWVGQVRHLLLELARASLADIPRLPENLSPKALPLIERGKAILDAASRQGISESTWEKHPELEWVECVRQFFVELTRISLSEHPRLPENLSLRSLELAERAQTIEEELEEAIEAAKKTTSDRSQSSDRSAVSSESVQTPAAPGLLIEQLQSSIKNLQETSKNPEASEWSQMMNLIDLMRSLYLRVKE